MISKALLSWGLGGSTEAAVGELDKASVQARDFGLPFEEVGLE